MQMQRLLVTGSRLEGFFLLDQLRGCKGVSRVDLDTLGLVSVFNKVYGDEGTLFRV